jgi:hypothetical protein
MLQFFYLLSWAGTTGHLQPKNQGTQSYPTSIKLYIETTSIKPHITVVLGARGRVVIKELCYKPEGCRFETR